MTVRRTIAATSLLLLSTVSVARADGEVDYTPGVCGGPNGSPPPTYSTLVDLPLIFSRIATYTLFPEQMYTGVWTNWYLSSDTKVRLAKLATMRSRLEENNLWDTYRVSSAAPATFTCSA